MIQENSVGIVETKFHKIEEKIKFESGVEFGPITVAYETYGELNETKDNAILLIHALTGDAHAAGYHSENDKKPGWWDTLIGPNKAFDTNKYYVICTNILGNIRINETGFSSCFSSSVQCGERVFQVNYKKSIIPIDPQEIESTSIFKAKLEKNKKEKDIYCYFLKAYLLE